MINFKNDKPKIAILRALQLGDMLCAIPAIRSLKKHFRHAEITLLGLPWSKSFIERYPYYFDRFIHFPGYEGLPEQTFHYDQWIKFRDLMQNDNFDCIIQMQGNGTIVNSMIEELGAKQIAGFHNKDCRMQSDLFFEYPEKEHEINRHLLLMRHLGIPTDNNTLEFPVSSIDKHALLDLAPFTATQPYVCVHAGSRGGWRQWPTANFAGLADMCAVNGYKVALTGTKDEDEIVRQVQKQMTNDCINLCGKTNLGVAAALIQKASLLISNCTGVSHIASALQTPSLIISMDGEPHRWKPLDHTLHKTIDWTRMSSYTYVKTILQQILKVEIKTV